MRHSGGHPVEVWSALGIWRAAISRAMRLPLLRTGRLLLDTAPRHRAMRHSDGRPAAWSVWVIWLEDRSTAMRMLFPPMVQLWWGTVILHQVGELFAGRPKAAWSVLAIWPEGHSKVMRLLFLRMVRL